MTLSRVQNLLYVVEQSLKICPRNAYEAKNRYEKNVEMLSNAQSMLKELDGAHVDKLRDQVDKLQAIVLKEEDTCSQGGTTGHGTFSFSLESELNDEIGIDDEMTQAEEVVKNRAKKKCIKSGHNIKNKSSKRNLLEVERSVPISVDLGLTAVRSEICPKSSQAKTLTQPFVEVSCKGNNQVDIMPPCLSGYSFCVPVPNSPFARVHYAGEVIYEGKECHCCVELYRSVLLALVMGKPVIDKPMDPVDACENGTERSHKQYLLQDEAGSEVTRSDVSLGEVIDDNKSDGVSHLLSELLLEYDMAQVTIKDQESNINFPTTISPQLESKIRRFSCLTWVILMCHGGYFAGGIFVERKCIIHKTLQYYVVRKKQGGRQSTSGKDGGGSYNSAGSIIRSSQELEWKLNVRDIILTWQPYIDSASVILYVAPGPHNVAMMTDFSSLPCSTASHLKNSPISLKDPRVQRVPITTHRPKFDEVVRIYETVSQYNIVYIVPTT